ncbi:CapA family protein [Actinokineospora sp. NBRC 105648]|uniref:CapA family protein n=1 Tax=Actinokineospora sp. NBRC 105648 TaxID=3032206 RepID=UPI0024A25DA2|nr:CapA family protein [Actinokineospora sp. NBRC 105648]GLZ41516.1 poly-gamma-glutamate biosynthesis protein [Actinokineospora sp. NBRC 105648]
MTGPARRVAAALGAAVLAAGCTGDPTVESRPVTTAPATTTPPASTAAAPAPSEGFTLIAGGDVLIHPALTTQAEADGGGTRDYAPLLAGIKPAIESADVALCHLETPLADKAGPFRGYPRFSGPPEIATALATTGFDTCSTASNHTLDQGPTGVTNTLKALDAAKITHTGSARSAAEAAKPLIRDVKGTKVGFVSYTFGLNTGTSRPPGAPWTANLLATTEVIAEAKAARAAGAEVVVASIHWGIEGKHEATTDQQRTAKALLTNPAIDLIIGHHAHVVQPIEKIGEKWVTYGLGNMIARHEEPKGDTEEGVLARFHFTKSPTGWTTDRAEYLPILTDLGPPLRLRDLTTDTTVNQARKTQALTRTDQTIQSRGATSAGLTRP